MLLPAAALKIAIHVYRKLPKFTTLTVNRNINGNTSANSTRLPPLRDRSLLSAFIIASAPVSHSGIFVPPRVRGGSGTRTGRARHPALG